VADVTIAGQSPLQPTQLRYAPAGGWAWPFDCGGVDIGLIPGTPAGEQEGAPCVDFLVQDVDQAYRTLRERGVRFLKEPHDTPLGRAHRPVRRPGWQRAAVGADRLAQVLRRLCTALTCLSLCPPIPVRWALATYAAVALGSRGYRCVRE